MTPSKRTKTQLMAGAPAPVTLAGREYKVAPLGFGAACLWLERAALLESELKLALPEGALDEDGKPTPEASRKMVRFLPRMAELVYEFMGLKSDEREALDTEMGLDFDRSAVEIVTAYFTVQALANPSAAAQLKKATAAIQRATPKTMSGRASR